MAGEAGVLKKSMKIHSGENPYDYKCLQCPYAVGEAGDLKTHMKTHAGEKPYKCSHCQRSFLAGRAGHLKIYMKNFQEKSHIHVPDAHLWLVKLEI